MSIISFKILFKNSTSLAVNKISISLIYLMVTALVARKLGSEQLGCFSLVMGVLYIFQLISGMGYDNIIIREVSKNSLSSARLMHNGFFLGIISCIFCALFMFIIAQIFHYPSFVFNSVFYCFLLLFFIFLNVISENLLIGLSKPHFILYASLVREVLWLILSVYFLLFQMNFDSVIKAYFISRGLGVIIFYILFKLKNISIFENGYIPKLKELFNQISTFLFINLFSNLIQEIDIIILYKYASLTDVGLYSIAKKITKISFLLLYSMGMTNFTLISDYFKKGKEAVVECFKLTSKQTVSLSLLIILIVYITSPIFIQMFYGQTYMNSLNILHFSIWKIIPLGLSFLWSRFLIIAHKQNQDLISLIIGLLIYILMTFIMVKSFGIMGFVIADLISISIISIIHLGLVNHYLFKRPWNFLKSV